MNNDQQHMLLSHIEDLCARAAAGAFCATAYLTPGEQMDITAFLQRTGHASRARFYGGFGDALRCCLLLFPDYAIELCDPTLEGILATQQMIAICGEEDPIQPLLIRGSGFCELTHRDYLGSLLALGLEREVLGDIELIDAHSAYVFCRAGIVGYLESSLERIANDRVRLERVQLPPDFASLRKTQPISDTVASARLDCVIAALVNCSRDRAQGLIRECRVELDYHTEERVDRVLPTPCTITVRGVGKFRVISIATQTKKGRYRLSAEKYV